MTRLKPLLVLAALAPLLAAPALAKEYNQSNIVPSDSQALINRLQAEFATGTDGEGFYGSFEDDCRALEVGATNGAGAPDNQVIIADKIINIGGRCRIVRSGGRFQPTERDQAGAPPPDLASGKPTFE